MLQVVLILLSILNVVSGATPVQNDFNYTDPEDFPPCDIPGVSVAFEPDISLCDASVEGIPIEDAYGIAHEYAPYLYHHPLEQYHLADPLAHLNLTGSDDTGKIWDLIKEKPGDFYGNMTADNLYNSARSPDALYSGKFFSRTFNGTTDWRAGEGFNSDGISQAPLYYNVFEYNSRFWVFNFHPYYAWNGCSNQWLISSFGNIIGSYMYYLCHLGVHEGDWENVSVMVCKSNAASRATNGGSFPSPLSVRYNQHDWNQIQNCSAGECVLNGTHPEGGVALNSHATYSKPTANMLYVEIPIPFIYNVRGVYLVDRTVKNPNKTFIPNSTNVVRYPNPDELNSTHPFKQLAYGGLWGNRGELFNATTQQPRCLKNDSFTYVDCPEDDPIFNIMLTLFGLKGEKGNPFYYNLLGYFAKPGNGPSGPLSKDYWNKWVGPVQSLLTGNGTAKDYCPQPDEWQATTTGSSGSNKNNIIGGFVGSIAMAIICAVLLILLLASRWCHPLRKQYSVTKADSLLKRISAFIRRCSPIWAAFFWLVALIGYIMFDHAIHDLVKAALQTYFPDVDWTLIIELTQLAGGLCLSFSGAFLLISVTMFYCIYRQSTNQSLPGFLKLFVSKNKINSVIINVEVGVMNISLFLSVLLFLFAFIISGIYYAFSEICFGVQSVVPDGICLDFQLFGMKEIVCGQEFSDFCSAFGRSSTNVLVWGAILFLLANFYIFLCATSIYWHYRYLFYSYEKEGDVPDTSNEHFKPSSLTNSNTIPQPINEKRAMSEMVFNNYNNDNAAHAIDSDSHENQPKLVAPNTISHIEQHI